MRHLEFLIFFIGSNFSLTSVRCHLDFKISYFNQRPSEESRLTVFMNFSLRHCLDECSRRSQCVAAGYHRLAQFCELFSESTVTSTEIVDYVTIRRDHIDGIDEKDAVCKSGQPNAVCNECDLPPPIAYGKYLGNMNQVGSKRAFVCDKGYIDRRRIKHIECKKNGQWDFKPNCKAMNMCERNNRPCERGHSCCNVTGEYVCKSIPKLLSTSDCPTSKDEWIPLRCRQFLIQINKLPYSKAGKACSKGNNSAWLVSVNAEWKIEFISDILLNCTGYSDSKYWVNSWRNDNTTKIVVPTKHKGLTRLWNENATTDFFTGYCLGLTKLNINNVESYRLDGFKCTESLPFICGKITDIN